LATHGAGYHNQERFVTCARKTCVSLPNIQILDNFVSLRAQLNQEGTALRSLPHADIFCTPDWFENLASVGLDPLITSSCQLWLVGDMRCGPVMCLPMLSGKVLNGLSNCFSSLFAPMVWTGSTVSLPDDAMCNAVVVAMRQHPARWSVVSLSPLDSQSCFFIQMQRALALAGYGVDTYFCFGNWYLLLEGRSFADYWRTLPSALRHSIERGQRRLDRQGPWQIVIFQMPDAALDGAVADFEAVYQKSWKGAEPNTQFIPGLVRMAASKGWLRLGVLKLDGQAIAVQLWLVKDSKASIFKLAYVNGFERFSAGSVLTHAMMRHVIDVDQVQEVDYLTGDDAYKRDWMSHRRERWGIVAFDWRTLSGLLAGCLHFAGKTLKGVSGLKSLRLG